jgi:hypothetical protein
MCKFRTKIDSAWGDLFDEYKILSNIEANGSFSISSSMINEIHEASLMAKFDQSVYLHRIFKKNKLSILPVTRGDYLIGPFVTYEPIV